MLVLGIAYKKNVDDLRESPALEILEALIARGADVAYADPHVPTIPRTRRHDFALASVDLSPAVVEAFDAVLLVTDHDAFDYDLVRRHARLLVDTRGRYREAGGNLVKA